MRAYSIFFGLLLVILLSACQSSPHFEKHIRFKNANWKKFTELKYDIPVESGKTYSFRGEIITDTNYTRRKLGIGFYLYLPGGEKRLEDHEIRIRDFEYHPLGEKNDDNTYTKSVQFRENLSISESGNIRLIIAQNSQYTDNFGVIGIDLIVKEDTP